MCVCVCTYLPTYLSIYLCLSVRTHTHVRIVKVITSNTAQVKFVPGPVLWNQDPAIVNRQADKVCVYLPLYLCLSIHTTWAKWLNGKSSLHVRSKSKLNCVLNFHMSKLCSEVVSFWQSVIQVWQLSLDFVNYLPFKFYRCLATEKQQCGPPRLLGIAYPFQLERGCIPYLCKRK